jgi:hypothetical protein
MATFARRNAAPSRAGWRAEFGLSPLKLEEPPPGKPREPQQHPDGYRSVRCGLTNRKTKLEFHHKDGNPLNNDLANLETLCVRHHREVGGGTPSRETAEPCPPSPSFSRAKLCEVFTTALRGRRSKRDRLT